MPKTTLPLGMGLDRYTGVMQVDAAAMIDMRNLRPLRGKLQARKGTIVQSELPDQNGSACTSVTLLHPVRSQSEGIAVGYYAGNREVHVYRVGNDGSAPAHIGKWFDLADSAASPPYFTAAESYGRAFIAHDEARQVQRAPTQLYDAVEGTFTDLTADFDGGGKQAVRFRGVESWSDYLIGWGYGNESEIRPELVRVSKPGEPDQFNPEHYFIVGDRGSPVTTVKQAGPALVSLKPTESYRIVGTSRLDFGIMPFYSLYGCLSTRLAVSVENTLFLWGFEGPWSVTGQQAANLEDPLSLETPFPVDLPPESTSRDAFAVYVPLEQVVEFHFGERIYALSLTDGALRWSFRIREGLRASCGALMYSENLADGSGVPPASGPSIVSVVGVGGTATLTWQNFEQSGSEIVEVWLARTSTLVGGQKYEVVARNLRPTYQIQLPNRRTDASDQQTTKIEGLAIGQEYSVAVRYRRGNFFSPGYESADPSDWPRFSRRYFTMAPAPSVINSARWIRASADTHVVRVQFGPAEGHENLPHFIYRDGVKVGVTMTGAARVFDDPGATLAQRHTYTVRAVLHGIESPDSNEVEIFAGPAPPSNPRYAVVPQGTSCPDGEHLYSVLWDEPGDLPFYRIQIRINSTPPVQHQAIEGRVNVLVCSPIGSFSVRLWAVQFGVTDFSEWVSAVQWDGT